MQRQPKKKARNVRAFAVYGHKRGGTFAISRKVDQAVLLYDAATLEKFS
jgi:hypothetical protein